MRIRALFIIVLGITLSCNREKEKVQELSVPERVVAVPAFNADSAYYFVQQQVNFGPRIPNSAAHKKTCDYLIQQLKKFGAGVTVQEFEITSYDNQKLALKNIIASYYPEKTKRILLAAHWDTRPFADKDPEKPKQTFDGANDGASGVGVLMEIARALNSNVPPEVGVDIILFDGEDWGYDSFTAEKLYGKNLEFPLPQGLNSWWCLGSQYWAKNKHKTNYSAYYGILLDMVGAKNGLFAKEGYSVEFAPSIVDKVWRLASKIGYAHMFINKTEGGITDDHVPVNEIAKIPMIDIINYDPMEGGFGDFHHTRKDNMDIIDKGTLKAVGETVLTVLYYEVGDHE